ncbi:glycosyltransferase family 2 protein [Mangrovibacillus cuniculi]|uniref:Glycosyltransferase family 2 protein n=1 Tax=Mangrovibacillus cuniculi TaxID=2593652 RepID=A0A7S8CD59_9BACI|nr:glycosyltransferase family 2 protein [Mangrovibacillus cuniculi]QPC47666.1 glycosyltransferase family 2 protein [Mangrovibacillus cuniculi]
MANNHVSVIIPTYNRPVELAELLESLTQQTFQDFDITIVNDNGTSINHIVTLYPELDVTIINTKENLHHIKARNEALKHASGTYIMTIDDDDWILPTHMETMVRKLEEEHADLAYSDVEIVHYKNFPTYRVPTSRHLFAYEYSVTNSRSFSTFVPSGALYRRALHDSLGTFDPHVRNYWDWDFFLRVQSSGGKIIRVPQASVIYAFGNNNASGNLENMRPYLDRLSEKHQLGDLPTANFWVLLSTPKMKEREAESVRMWDGLGVISRLASTTTKEIVS